MNDGIYELDVKGAIFAMELARMPVPDWMRHSRIPNKVQLRAGRIGLAMDMLEEQLPIGLADEIYQLETGNKVRPLNDPPMGFRLDSVLFFSRRGVLREVLHADA